MAPFIFRCPNTGRRVQGWSADEAPSDGDAYETISCLACRRVHLVNPTTGKLLGEEEDEE
jgi:hypothetical protein